MVARQIERRCTLIAFRRFHSFVCFMRDPMKFLRCMLSLPLILAVYSGTSAVAQEPSANKTKLLTLLGRPLQVTVGESHGLFAKYGVTVETQNLPNSDELRSALAAGHGDL